MQTQSNVIGDRINEAKALRAQSRIDNSQKNESITVRTRDEKSNVVFRFSNPGNKLKSKRCNEADSNEFLIKYLTKLDREAIGVWSVLGIPFKARGDPDLTLIKKAQQAREARKLKLKQKNSRRDSTVHPHHSSTWGGNGHSSSKNEHSKKTLHSSSDPDSIQSDYKININRTDLEQYSFPKEFILESEMRCKQSMNGIPYAKIIQEQANKSGPLFETLKIDPEVIKKENPKRASTIEPKSRKMSRQSTMGFGMLTHKSTHRSLTAITEISKVESEAKKEFEIDGREIQRWSDDFQAIRDDLHKKLYKKLANGKLDRIEAYQSPELLGIAVSYSSNPKQYEDLAIPKRKSIWTKCKQIHYEQEEKKNEVENDDNYYSTFYNSMISDVSRSIRDLHKFRDNDKSDDELDEQQQIEKSKEFYRNLLCFIERIFGGNIINNNNQQNEITKQKGLNEFGLNLVMDIKKMLEEGNICDHTFFYQLLMKYQQYLEQDVSEQDEQILDILSFIRGYFNITNDDLNTFFAKMEWKIQSLTKSLLAKEI